MDFYKPRGAPRGTPLFTARPVVPTKSSHELLLTPWGAMRYFVRARAFINWVALNCSCVATSHRIIKARHCRGSAPQ